MVFANDYKLIYAKDGNIYASKEVIPTADDTKLCTLEEIKGRDFRNYNGGIYELKDGKLEKLDVSAILVGNNEESGEQAGDDETEEPAYIHNHPADAAIDADGDGKCDVCDADMPAEPVVQTVAKTTRTKKATTTVVEENTETAE